MSLSAFLKENAVNEENLKLVVSDRFVEKDEEGNARPIEWEIKTISSSREEEIKASCTRKVEVRKGLKMPETDFSKYLAKLAAACTVYPNLNDAKLQESYGVMGAANLLREMLLPGEFSAYINKIQEFNGFDSDFNAEVEEAKN